MNSQSTRLRINLSTREIEIEGSEEFVREYAQRLEDAISLLMKPSKHEPVSAAKIGVQEEDSVPPMKEIPEIFGEFFAQFPRGISDNDKVLVAAYYTQTRDPEKKFKTKEANNYLKEQGIKVANASEAVRQQIRMKRMFSVGKGSYKVSQQGLEYIESLKSQ